MGSSLPSPRWSDAAAPVPRAADPAAAPDPPGAPKTRPPTPAGDTHGNDATERILAEIDALPTLPAVAARLMRAASNDEVAISEIVRLIESDPSLTARTLSLCRRAAHGLGHRITTVSHAVVMLGLETVRAMVLSVQVLDWDKEVHQQRVATRKKTSQRTEKTDEETGGMDRVGFWKHSIAVACCAELIAREHPRRVGGYRPEEAFVAGLLHDLGKLALELVLPKAYERVVRLCELRQGDIARFERAVLGIDHHQAGLLLAEKWGLPKPLCDVIAHHGRWQWSHTLAPAHRGAEPRGLMVADIDNDEHELDETLREQHASALAGLRKGVHAESREGRGRGAPATMPLVKLVTLADAVCRRLHLGWSGNHAARPSVDKLAASMGVPTETIRGLYSKIYEATSERQRDLGLAENPSEKLFVEAILQANARLGMLNTRLAETNAELKRTQHKLAEHQAMARLGELTAGAAHEMNNPLAVISGRAQSLLRSLDSADNRAAARAIVDASGRLTDLITRLHLIARPPEPKLGPVNVVDLLSDVVKEARRRTTGLRGKELPKKQETLGPDPEASEARSPLVPIRVVVASNIPPAALDRSLMAKALIEVVTNAIEASPRTGVEVRVHTEPKTGRLFIHVIDDGVGMSEHAAHHAMDPFFSSKPAGRQPGLGLATAHRLIRLHGGEITLASHEGAGTTATIRLPDWRWRGSAAEPARDRAA